MQQLSPSPWHRKPLAAPEQQPTKATSLHRSLSALDLTMLGIGAIMGTGIFVVTGKVAASVAGPAVIVSFAIAGLAAAFAALCYAEMAGLIPQAGSAYAYAYAAFGELPAFLMGWNVIFTYGLSAAMVSVGWSGYFQAFCAYLFGGTLPEAWAKAPLAWDPLQQKLVATGAIVNSPALCLVLLLTLTLTRGVDISARFNAWMVVIKLSVALLFIVAAAPYIQLSNLVPFVPANTGTFGAFGYSGLLQGATVVFLSYAGFDAVSVAAQEAKNPQRDVPIGMLTALFVCACLYMLVSLVLTGVVHYTELAVPHPIAKGIAVVQQPWLELAILIGALAGLTSVVLVLLLALPRVLMAMAEDNLMPSWVGTIHPTFGTPALTTLTAGSLIAVAAGLLPEELLAEGISVGSLLLFAVVSAGVIVMRFKAPSYPRVFRVPGGAWPIPITSLLICLLLLAAAKTEAILRITQWLCLGACLYFIRRYRLQAKGQATSLPPSS